MAREGTRPADDDRGRQSAGRDGGKGVLPELRPEHDTVLRGAEGGGEGHRL